MRFTFVAFLFITAFSSVEEDPLNRPPVIVSIYAPSYISASDTVFIKTYDDESDTLVVTASVSTASENSVSGAFIKLFRDDGLAGDLTANDNLFTGVINRSALLAQATSQFTFKFTVTEKKTRQESSQTVIVSQNPSSGHPPVIANLNAPDTVNTSLVTQFLITLQVSDPEGLSDIASVTRTTPSDLVLNLNDNGLNGDVTAGDGIYSELVSVSPAPPNGSYLFTFQATDRLGLKSNTIQKTIVIIN